MSSSQIAAIKSALQAKKAIKTISGITNFNIESVLKVVHASTQAQVTAIDVSAQADIIQAARQATDLPLFASCINPENLAKAVELGADAVELGNYDGLYEQGLFLSHDEVLKLAQQTMDRINGQALVCVTIPGHLTLSTQIQLAQKLQAMGVDLIQTEGASRALSAQPSIQPLNATEKAELTLSNARALASENIIPVMAASGIATSNIATAFEWGAAAVGIGSAVNKLATEAEMVAVLTEMKQRVAQVKPAAKQVSLAS